VSADDRALLEAVATLTPQRRVVTVLRYGSATRRPRSRGCWSCRRARSTCCSCCCRHGRWRGRLPCPGSDRHGGGVFRWSWSRVAGGSRSCWWSCSWSWCWERSGGRATSS